MTKMEVAEVVEDLSLRGKVNLRTLFPLRAGYQLKVKINIPSYLMKRILLIRAEAPL